MAYPALDDELAAALDAIPGGLDPGDALTDMNVVRLLRNTLDLFHATGGRLPSRDDVTVRNDTISSSTAEPLGVRIYTPAGRSSVAPAMVYFHGGGFVIGDVYTEELRCLRFSAEAGCVVVSVGYRLAPEHPFPAALDDGYDALCWTASHADDLSVDRARIALGGASAGGALAAGLALKARDLGGPDVVFQLLVYPVLDDRMVTPSMCTFDATPLWTNRATTHMWQHYLGDAAAREPVSPYAAPMRAADLRGLPAAYIVTAQLDPLRDEGLDYGRRLIEADVPTEVHNVPGAYHGFDIVAPRATVSRRAVDEQIDALRRGVRSAPA
jgi:acetyl esterase/lipase